METRSKTCKELALSAQESGFVWMIVGAKTGIVSHLAKVEETNIIEVNLEKKPELASSFSSNEPATAVHSYFLL